VAVSLDGSVPVVADVSQEAGVAEYVAAAVDRHGRIDLFFNNAGIEGRMAPMTELSVEDFDRVLAVNRWLLPESFCAATPQPDHAWLRRWLRFGVRGQEAKVGKTGACATPQGSQG